MRKPAFCICENKDADQLCGTAQLISAFVFATYIDSTIPLLAKSEISSLWLSSVVVQPDLCQTWSETQKTVFSQRGIYHLEMQVTILPKRILITRNTEKHKLSTAMEGSVDQRTDGPVNPHLIF